MFCSENLSDPFSDILIRWWYANATLQELTWPFDSKRLVLLPFFNIQMSHVALLMDFQSKWQCIAYETVKPLSRDFCTVVFVYLS